MTIAMILKPSAGNALRVFLQPPVGASSWRVLRKLADTFTGETDVDAAVVHDGDERVVLDADGLVNGVTYYYRPYYLVGSSWQAGATVSSVPLATYDEQTPDVIRVVKERLEAGLLVELQRQNLTHENGAVPVFTAPPAYGAARWPIVSVHLTNEEPVERFIGESIVGDEFDAGGGQWTEPEGWLSRVELAVVGWSLNSDERGELRRALRRIVMANLPVFDSYGFINVTFSQQDMEDFESYEAPVYQAMCTFSCLAPVSVLSGAGVIRDVTQTITAPT
jgi:hypothetical protein